MPELTIRLNGVAYNFVEFLKAYEGFIWKILNNYAKNIGNIINAGVDAGDPTYHVSFSHSIVLRQHTASKKATQEIRIQMVDCNQVFGGGYGWVYLSNKYYRVRNPVVAGNFNSPGKKIYEDNKPKAIKLLYKESLEKLKQEFNFLALYHNQEGVKFFYNPVIGIPGFVMPAVMGETLASYRENHEISLPTLIIIASKLIEEFQIIHRLNFAHLDVSSTNIMVGRDAGGNRIVKLIDFGFAKFLNAVLINKVDGTRRYLSPEAIHSNRYAVGRQYSLDLVKSEIYAIGGVLLELMADEAIFSMTKEIDEFIEQYHKPLFLAYKQKYCPIVPRTEDEKYYYNHNLELIRFKIIRRDEDIFLNFIDFIKYKIDFDNLESARQTLFDYILDSMLAFEPADRKTLEKIKQSLLDLGNSLIKKPMLVLQAEPDNCCKLPCTAIVSILSIAKEPVIEKTVALLPDKEPVKEPPNKSTSANLSSVFKRLVLPQEQRKPLSDMPKSDKSRIIYHYLYTSLLNVNDTRFYWYVVQAITLRLTHEVKKLSAKAAASVILIEGKPSEVPPAVAPPVKKTTNTSVSANPRRFFSFSHGKRNPPSETLESERPQIYHYSCARLM